MADNPLAVRVGQVALENPVLVASGTFGFGEEYGRFYDLSCLGGVMTKGITAQSRQGNPPPRIVETAAGILNSVGLQNPGVEGAISGPLPWLREQGTVVIANVAGYSLEEYVQVAGRLDRSGLADVLELNVSCPNVKGGGLAFGTDAELLRQVIAAVRSEVDLPLWVKLSPNVADLRPLGRVAQEEGADALTLINTISGMAIDIESRRPLLVNSVGGLSGPAVKPIALRMVWELYREVNLPLVGMGGIVTGRDALEFMLAGASAVAVGTGNFLDPRLPVNVVEELRQYVNEKALDSISDLTGALETG